MSSLVRLLRTTHCRNARQYVAIDALQRIETAPGQRLAKLLLKHYDAYLRGAAAAEARSGELQSQTTHAAEAEPLVASSPCESWLNQAIERLDQRHWKLAAYACGVLSQYFTDPLTPLRRSPAEFRRAVHRRLSWSLYKNYDAIVKSINGAKLPSSFQLAHGADWIRRAASARESMAHQHVQRLLDLLDRQPGLPLPSERLDNEAQALLAELSTAALSCWAQILTRIADTTTAELPVLSLNLTTLLTAVDVPLAWTLKKFSESSERRALKLLSGPPPSVVNASPRRAQQQQQQQPNLQPLPSQRFETQPQANPPESTQPPPTQPESLPAGEVASLPRQRWTHLSSRAASPRMATKQVAARETTLISDYSPLVDAPLIGPKTAKRFERIGILTVGEFLRGNPARMAADLTTRWMTEELLLEWQDQTRRACVVPYRARRHRIA